MKSSLLTTLRYLLKNKVYTTITIVNLTIGFFAFLIIMKYVRHETSFDKFYPDVDNVYRISYERYKNGALDFHNATTMTALAPALKREFPEIKEAIRVLYEEALIYIEDKDIIFNNTPLIWADEGFFKIFPIKLKSGDINTVLKEPYTTAISERMAKKLFGDENPIGKTFSHNEGIIFRVTGVFENIPDNTHLHAEIVYSYSTFIAGWDYFTMEGNWEGDWVWTYILTDERFDVDGFQKKLTPFINKYLPDIKKDNIVVKFHPQPVKHIHLDSDLNKEIGSNGSRQNVLITIIIALTVLIMSWINYFNSLIAQISDRRLELGIRKIIGQNRLLLFTESIMGILIINLISLALSGLIIMAINPLYNQLFDLKSSTILYSNPFFWFSIVLFIIIGVICVGVYPSIVNASIKPTSILSHDSNEIKRSSTLKAILMGTQFFLSMLLIFNSLVINKQLNSLTKKGVGFNKSDVVVMRMPETLFQTSNEEKLSYIRKYRNRMFNYPEIKEISFAEFVPGAELRNSRDDVQLLNTNNSNNGISFFTDQIDYNYFKVFEIDFLAGKDFDENFSNGRRSVIINEKALKSLNISKAEDAINREIKIGDEIFNITGVTKDYYHQGIDKKVKPTIYFYNYAYDFGYITIRIQHKTLANSITIIKRHWEEIFPIAVFNYQTMEDFFYQQYKDVFKLKKIVSFFTIIAIILACSGLYSISLITLRKRRKEISIRYSLGASIGEVMFLLLKDFVLIIFVFIIIAGPFAYKLANTWLQNFAYKIELNAWMFIISGFFVILISVLTIIRQVYLVSTLNIAAVLKDE